MENTKREYLHPAVEVMKIDIQNIMQIGSNVELTGAAASTHDTGSGEEYETLSRGSEWWED
jgi:hypothetical protein